MDGAAVMDKWRVEPDDIRFIKALSGDSSDNIKGIKGVGPKTATKIFYEAQGVIERIMENAKVFPHREQFLDNLSLVTLKYMADELGPIEWSDYKLGLGMVRDWEQFLCEYELNGLAKRVGKTTEMMKLRG